MIEDSECRTTVFFSFHLSIRAFVIFSFHSNLFSQALCGKPWAFIMHQVCAQPPLRPPGGEQWPYLLYSFMAMLSGVRKPKSSKTGDSVKPQDTAWTWWCAVCLINTNISNKPADSIFSVFLNRKVTYFSETTLLLRSLWFWFLRPWKLVVSHKNIVVLQAVDRLIEKDSVLRTSANSGIRIILC
jgi:hypothetical protein